MNSSTPAIDIQNLAYCYGKAEAVHDLSLRALPGATVQARRPP